MKNIGYIAAVFSLLIFFAFSYLRPTATFSEIENRYLTDFVKPNPESVLQSEWQKQITEAANDQVIFRDWFAELTVAVKRLAGQRDVGGVYFGRDGYYIEKVLNSDVSLAQYEKNLQIVNQAMKNAAENGDGDMKNAPDNKIRDIKNTAGYTTDKDDKKDDLHPKTRLQVCLVPSSGVILQDKLPGGASIYDADTCYRAGEELFADSWLDLRPVLKEAAEKQQIYFRTDHHWTTYGAYVGADAFLEADKVSDSDVEKISVSNKEKTSDSNIEKLSASNRKALSDSDEKDILFKGSALKPIEEYGLQEAKEKFYGTLYSKAPFPGAKADPLILPTKLRSYQVTIDDGETCDSIYQETYLTQKDKYAVYFGGNYGIVRIKADDRISEMQLKRNSIAGTAAQKNRKKLVLIKDSYANSMVPYLISCYDEIVMIDLRYYNGSFQQMMQEEQPDTVLVLYEMSSFMKCDTLFKLLK